MMRRTRFEMLCVAWIVLGFVPALPAQQDDPWKDKQVMAVRWNAELKTGNEVIGRAQLGQLLTVAESNGDWLWVENFKGWIHQRDVVLLDQAVDHFTAAISQNRTSQAYRERGIARVSLGQYKPAIGDFSTAIQLDSRNVAAYNDRGNAYHKTGNLEQAKSDFTEIIGKGARQAPIYTNRGMVWHTSGDYDRAIADYNEAIRLDAAFAPAWEAGGAARQAKREYSKAVENYRKAIQLDPNFDRAHNNLAWLMATCPDEKVRNGKLAVEYAQKLCERTGYSDPGYLDTLAAAHAEAGQFDEAVKRAQEAEKLSPENEKAAIQSRLALYKAGKPFREK